MKKKENKNKEVKVIVERYGMSVKKQAEAMGLSVQTVYNKQNLNVKNDCYNSVNLSKLKDYIRKALKNLHDK